MAIYSPADLAANWDGWRFWDSLIGGSELYIIQDWNRKWIQARPFRMVEHARSDLDEVTNPPYSETPRLATAIQSRISKTSEEERKRIVFREPAEPGDVPCPEFNLYRVSETSLPAGATRIRFACPAVG